MELVTDSKLIQNLFLKSELLRAGSKEHEKIRPVLLVCSGGMGGVSGVGQVIAFHLLGLGDVFDAVIGVSTGAGIGAYFLGGLEQALLGTSTYYEDLPPRFIRYTRWPIVDIDFVEQILREGKKKLDLDAIKKARSEFFVEVTDSKGGCGLLLNAKKAKPDMITTLKASMAMLGVYSKPVEVDGRFCIDGGAHPLPIREVVKLFNPTDVVVIPNCSREQAERWTPSLAEKICTSIALLRASSKLRESWRARHQRWQEDLQFLTTLTGVNKGVLWAASDVGLLESDPEKLRRVAQGSVVETLSIFGKPHKEFQLL